MSRDLKHEKETAKGRVSGRKIWGKGGLGRRNRKGKNQSEPGSGILKKIKEVRMAVQRSQGEK